MAGDAVRERNRALLGEGQDDVGVFIEFDNTHAIASLDDRDDGSYGLEGLVGLSTRHGSTDVDHEHQVEVRSLL